MKSANFVPFLWCLVWAGLLFAAGHVHATEPGSGLLELMDSDGNVHYVASLDTRVDYQVHGLVAEVRVAQRFRNRGDDWLEGQYLLPLPEGAAVHAMTLKIGERLIEGEIREKQAARKVFRQARRSGRRAALVESDGANLFRTKVTNVAPGEEVSVELRYWQRVQYEGGKFSLRFPLTYRGRYRASLGTTSAQADPGITGAQRFALARQEPPVAVRIHVDLDAGVSLAEVSSPSHEIVIDHKGRQWAVRLRDTRVVPDRDFVLMWQPVPSAAPEVAVFRQDVDGAHYAMMMLMPPQQDVRRLPRELILVIDTSGSMSGTSMRQARAAVQTALDQLRPGDRFNVVEFDSDMRAWRPDAVPASAVNLQNAHRWVAGLDASGGTEMAPALRFALQGQAPEGYVRQVVFATDGAVANPAGLMNIIDANLGNSRLFPVGIGSAPNADFLVSAARHGRGSETVISNLSQVQSAMHDLMAKLDYPAVRDLAIDWPAGAEAYPQRMPDLYLGEPILAVARLPMTAGQIGVEGMLAHGHWQTTINAVRSLPAQGLDKLWAEARISELENRIRRGADETLLKPKIVATALAAHLVSRYTSLVAVERTPVRARGEHLKHAQIPNVVPAGSAFAQTATPAQLELLLGLLALLGAGLLWRLQGRPA